MGMPVDGIGYLRVEITYVSIDRVSSKTSTRLFRVRTGPVMPKRTIIRSQVQHDLDGVLDAIEQFETGDVEPQ